MKSVFFGFVTTIAITVVIVSLSALFIEIGHSINSWYQPIGDWLSGLVAASAVLGLFVGFYYLGRLGDPEV